MRVLVVSTWFPHPQDNGSRLRIAHLLEAMSREHALTLLSFGRPEGGEEEGPLRRFCEAVHVVPDVRPARLGLPGLFAPVPRYFAQTRSEPMLALVRAHAPAHDVIVAMQVRAAYHVSEARVATPWLFEEAEAGAAMIVGDLAATPPWRRARQALTWWKHRRFLAHLIHEAGRVTVVSPPERDHLIAIGGDPNRIAVVPNGVVVPDAPLGSAPRLPQIIYPGAVTFSANLDAVSFFIRDVWPRIRRVRPDLLFVVTGETAGVDVSALAAVDGVQFTGCLPEVDTVIASSAACVVPLRAGGGTRLKVLHAMALGTPVVSTTKGIEGLDLEPGRHVLVGDTADALTAQTLRLIKEPALGHRLAAEALQRVRDCYTWDASAAVLMDELLRIPGDGRGYRDR